MRVGITGHRGLPTPVAERVRALLAEQITQYESHGLVAVSCIADGPDSWWAQTVLATGGRLEAVIPASRYRAGLPDWHHDDYDELLAQAAEVHATGFVESTSEAHQAGSEVLVGLSDVLLAVWDGQPARGYGGTAGVVDYANRVGVPVTVLWPEGARR